MSKSLRVRLQDCPGAVRARLIRLKPLLKPWCIMSGVYILGISAILRANYSYVDDLMRAYSGYRGWDDFSRYLSNFLSPVIHADTYLTDVSPLPQLLACVILGAASVVVLRTLTGRDRFTFWEYAAVLPLGLSPYMLECLAFKFDSPYFSLSVLVSVLPLCWVDAPPRRMALAAFLGTMAMCLTYQAASGILPMFVLLLAVKRWQEGERFRTAVQFTAAAAVGYCAAVILFKLLLVRPVTNSYTSTAMPAPGQLLPHAAQVLRTYFSHILREYDWKWLGLAGVLFLGYVWTSVRRSARKKYLALLLALACPAVMLLMSFGLYPLLENPLIQGRSMFGTGAWLASIGVSVAAEKKAVPVKLACLALSWCFFVFAFTYGNALYAQKTYTEFRIEEVVDSVKEHGGELFTTGDTVILQINGDIGFAPVLHDSIARFPMLGRLVPHTFGDYSWVTSYGFAKYYGLPELSWAPEGTYDLEQFHLPLLDETLYHAIYGSEHFLLIELK